MCVYYLFNWPLDTGVGEGVLGASRGGGTGAAHLTLRGGGKEEWEEEQEAEDKTLKVKNVLQAA